FYDANSLFGSIEKQLNKEHSLALTLFGARVKSGRSSYNVAEIMNLADDHYYNSFWGYQNGKVRNAAVGNNFQPIGILTHFWDISDKSNLQTAVSFQTGKNKLSGIDWYKAADPRPDYYRNLPSFNPNGNEPGNDHAA